MPYTPDLMAFITKFAQATAYYDGNGHYARVSLPATGQFAYDPATACSHPQPASQRYDAARLRALAGSACPGAATQPAPDGSSPFLADGVLAGKCDPADTPRGLSHEADPEHQPCSPSPP